MNKPYFCRIFFFTDWRHKRLKNTIVILYILYIFLLLFYGEHFYGFSESDLKKVRKINLLIDLQINFLSAELRTIIYRCLSSNCEPIRN